MEAMRYGLCIFLTHYAASPAATARAAEDFGFESLWVPEHPCIPVHYETPFPGSADGKAPRPYWSSYDPFVALSFAAAATSKIRLATGICLVAQRDPIVTAKEVASLDVLSGGRIPLRLSPKEAKEGKEKIASYARAAGRDASKIEISVFGSEPSLDQRKAYEDAGVHRYVIFQKSAGPWEMERQLSALAGLLGL